MKVVLFCGGLGMRLREFADSIPKPMVQIGYRPILWHLMKYYAHYGHKDFILCLGYKADVIKNYFRNYDECVSNDFVLEDGGKRLELLHSDIQDWKITFVDTGLNSNIGQRLKAVERHLNGEEMFLANYTDGLSDLPLDDLIDFFRRQNKIACFAGVKPTQSFHLVSLNPGGEVKDIRHISQAGMRINGGFFAFRREIFEHMKEGEELVQEPFQRLMRTNQLVAYMYDGFWACMDTFKERQALEDQYARGDARWEVWKGRSIQEPVGK